MPRARGILSWIIRWPGPAFVALLIVVFGMSFTYTFGWSGLVGSDDAWLISADIEVGRLILAANWATEDFRRASSFYDRGAMGLHYTPINPARRSYHLPQAWRFSFDRRRSEHIHRYTAGIPGWLIILLAAIPPLIAWIFRARHRTTRET